MDLIPYIPDLGVIRLNRFLTCVNVISTIAWMFPHRANGQSRAKEYSEGIRQQVKKALAVN
jgi:hypothetical protein